MAKMDGSFLCIIVLWMCVTLNAQVTPSTTRRPSTTEKPPSQRGVVFTMKKLYYMPDGAQIRSIPVIPFYDEWDSMVPGIKFSDSAIHFLSVDSDFQTKNLYLYDYHLKSIAIGLGFNTDLDLKNMSFEFMHEGVSEATVQIALDWLSHTVYWVDPGFGWIAAAPGDPSRIDEDLHKIIINGLDKPDGLALDPLAGLMFWSEKGSGNQAKIERATLTGENRLTIVTRGLRSARSLEADHQTQRLFWIDHESEEIESSNYDGTDRRRVRMIIGANMYDLAIYKEMLIITDISDGSIFFLNKTSGESLHRTIRIGSEIAYGVAVYTSENQPLKTTDHCTNKQCPHLCLSKENDAECVCSEGFEYLASNNSCVERLGSYHRAMILVSATDICYGDIRSLAGYRYNATCVFTTTLSTTPWPTTTVRPQSSMPQQRTTRLTTHRPPSTTPIQSPKEAILFIDLDMEKRIMYFASEQKIWSRPVDDMRYANSKTAVTATNLIIRGLVFDWIDGFNLYYSTSVGYIYVKNVQDTSLRMKATASTNDVSGLVLMPHERKLAWIASDGSRSKIESWAIGSSMTNLTTVIENRTAISDLCYDQHTKTFYWIESYYVYRLKADGSDTANYIRFKFPNTAFQILVYKNVLVVAEKNGTTTQFQNIDLTSDRYKVIADGRFPNLLSISHFKILDPELQPFEPNPCNVDFGSCSQICYTSHDANGNKQKMCDCSYGFTLQPDGRTCNSAASPDIDCLLVSDGTHDQFNQVDITTEQFHALDIDVSGTPSALLYNPLTSLVMFTFMNDENIYSTKLDGQVAEVFTELSWFVSPNRFALDNTTGNIYYTATYEYIGVITPHKTYLEIEMNELYIADIQAVALHPQRGYMYFTVRGYSPYIGRSFMNGEQHEILIQNSSIVKWPEGLAIDYTSCAHKFTYLMTNNADPDQLASSEANRSGSTLFAKAMYIRVHQDNGVYKGEHLYWSDRYHDTIRRCDLNGRNCELFIEDRGADISDIQTDAVHLYYTGLSKGLYKVKLDDPDKKKEKMGTLDEPGRLDTLSIYVKNTINKQPVADHCSANNGKGDCSTICLPKPNGRTCACDYGRDLKGDGKTCIDVFQCEQVIGHVFAPDTCSRYMNTVCQLQCENGYTMAPNTTKMSRNCTNLGWEEARTISDMCIEKTCPLRVDHVIFGSGCNGTVGFSCPYVCKPGYKPTQNPATAACESGGRWNIENDFCEEIKCPVLNTIANGAFVPNCTGSVNSVCRFTCEQFYSPFRNLTQMTCQPSGTWNGDVTSICVPTKCPEAIMNGRLDGSCYRTVGSSCPVICNANFVSSVATVTCTSIGKWSPETVCKHRGVKETKSDDINELQTTCNAFKPTQQKPPAGLSGGQAAGLAVGVLILIMIAVVIVALVVLYKRRLLPGRFSSSPSAKYSTSDIAIENPGYMNATINVSDDSRQENPYDNTNGFQAVGFANVPPTDTGYSNPLYKTNANFAGAQEPLPEQVDIGVTQEDIVLTTDSWQKEQLKGPDA